MSTQVSNAHFTIDTLIGQRSDLIAFLDGLDLLNNSEKLASLETRVDNRVSLAFEELESLTYQVSSATARFNDAEHTLRLADNDYQQEQVRLTNLIGEKNHLRKLRDRLQLQKKRSQEDFDAKKIKANSEQARIDFFDDRDSILDIRDRIDDLKNEVIPNRQEKIRIKEYWRDHHQGLADHHDGLYSQYQAARTFSRSISSYGLLPLIQEQRQLRDEQQQLADILQEAINELQDEVDKFEKNLFVLEEQVAPLGTKLAAHVQNLNTQAHLFSVYDVEYEQDLERLDTQIQQVEADLAQLETQDIDLQDQVLRTVQQRLNEVQFEWGQAQSSMEQATSTLDQFLDAREDLILEETPFVSLEENGEASEFRELYQFLALQELEAIDDRLTSLQSQVNIEDSIDSALRTDSLESYSNLVDELTQDISALTDIGLETLKEINQFTVSIWNELEEHSAIFEHLESFVAEALAEPHEAHYLNQVQLDEAIQREVAQAAYRDSLATSVDSTEETVELLNLQVEQVEEISNQLGHIEKLIEYERQYKAAALSGADADIVRPLLIRQLSQDIDNRQDEIPIQLLDLSFDSYIEERHETILNSLKIRFSHNGFQDNKSTIKKGHQQELNDIIAEENAIVDFQSLRIELTHISLVSETTYGLQIVQSYLLEYRNSDRKEDTIKSLRDKYFLGLNEAETLTNLRANINAELFESQKQLSQLQVSISEKDADASAALSQAIWYEEQARIHWEQSRKSGPTWNEHRTTWKRDKSGRRKRHVVTISHVDHDWIIWDNYIKQANNLKAYAQNLLQDIEIEEANQDVVHNILTQWEDVSQVVDEADLIYEDLSRQLLALEAERALSSEQQAQLSTFEYLLPILQGQLATAQSQADVTKARVEQEWQEYDASSNAYQSALDTVLARQAALDAESQSLLLQIGNTEKWVKNQSAGLDTEIEQVASSKALLQAELDELKRQIETNGTSGPDLIAQQVHLETSVQLLTEKETVLTSQKAALIQQQSLLNAQREVVVVEQQLLEAYLESPDDDYSILEAQLQDAQAVFQYAQNLAKQAESHSQTLDGVLKNLSNTLESQGNTYLEAVQKKHQALQKLADATELEANYNFQKVEALQELNTLESQLISLLQAAADAGNQEAQHLLDVVQFSNFETAAETYHRDYRDLMSDRGGSCSGGVARPEDIAAANKYYNDLIQYRELKEQAQKHANDFKDIKEEAEAQVESIKQQQANAQQALDLLNDQLVAVEGDIQDIREQITSIELQLGTLQQLRSWTEQALVQVLQVEQLSLAQAQLEEKFLQQRQEDINESIAARLERDRLSLERDFNISTAKIERLNQVQAEDAFQNALNSDRIEVGQEAVEDLINAAELDGQLAGLQVELDTLVQKATFPADVQTLLDETSQQIEDFLKNDETIETIQENLLNGANALIRQANLVNTELEQIGQEEQIYRSILLQSETDLQGAAQQLHDELERSQSLGDEKDAVNQEYLTVLYQVGYAQGAVDLSSELAETSKQIIDEIIDGRIEERQTREKAFLNDLLGTITTALDLASTVLLFTPLAPFASTLKLASGLLSAVQAAYNNDWAGAIFDAGMAVLSYGLDNAKVELKLANDARKADDVIKTLESTVKSFQTAEIALDAAYASYQGYESGDTTLALLQAVKGAADSISMNISTDDIPLSTNILVTAGQISVNAHQGIQALEDDEIIDFGRAAISIGETIKENFFPGRRLGENIEGGQDSDNESGDSISSGPTIFDGLIDFGEGIADDVESFLQDNFNIDFDDISDLYEDGQRVYQTINYLVGTYENGGLTDWLSSIDRVLGIWGPEIQNLTDSLFHEEEVLENAKQVAESIDNLEIEDQAEAIHELPEDFQSEVIHYLLLEYPTPEDSQAEHLEDAQIPEDESGVSTSDDSNQQELFNQGLDIVSDANTFRGVINALQEASDPNIKVEGSKKILAQMIIDEIADFTDSPSDEVKWLSIQGKILQNNDFLGNFLRTQKFVDKVSPYLEEINSLENKLDDKVDDLIKFSERSKGVLSISKIGGSFSIALNVGQIVTADPGKERAKVIAGAIAGSIGGLVGAAGGPLVSFGLSAGLDFLAKKAVDAWYPNDAEIDPIVFDLNNDGINLVSINISPVTFDMDNDGLPDPTGWVSPDDALLAQDRNNDGQINNISELFSEYYSPDTNTGLQALATLDSNQDQIIDTNDDQFHTLSLWQDHNTNGQTDPGELTLLSNTDITFIQLDSTPINENRDGNILLSTTEFSRVDGSIGQAAEVAFLVEPTDPLTRLPSAQQLVGDTSSLNGADNSFSSLIDPSTLITPQPITPATPILEAEVSLGINNSSTSHLWSQDDGKLSKLAHQSISGGMHHGDK